MKVCLLLRIKTSRAPHFAILIARMQNTYGLIYNFLFSKRFIEMNIKHSLNFINQQ